MLIDVTMIRRLAIPMLMLIAIAVPTLAEACPLCSQALSGQSKYGNLPMAYMWSILFMMSMPFILIGSFGTYMYFQIRKARTSYPQQLAEYGASDGPTQDAVSLNAEPVATASGEIR
jgi:hypothetical protein